MYSAAGGAYGACGASDMGQKGGLSFPQRVGRRKMNVVGVAVSTFVPWLIFCLLSAALSFEMHYRQPSTTQALVMAVACVLVLVLVGDVWWICIKRSMGQAGMANASWLLFLCVTGLVAVCLAVVFGNRNFWVNSEPFFDVTALNSYDSVDPSGIRGQELMDAGQILFAKNAHLDLSKSMGFKNSEKYCVAPITASSGSIWNPPLATYDFWAVGKDCCSGALNTEFHCGAYDNPHARGGVRMVRDEERAFYRLAVQQAQSTYAIKAVHPLFFHWVEDPVEETYRMQQSSFKAYFLAMAGYLACQLLLVSVASSCFSRLSKC